MRPLSLKMTAFGPYACEQVVNFAELKNRNFFLIHGPTGAGKTTILDAICYALYGDASGTQRDGKCLRSDYADPSQPTEVVLDFAIGHNTYRVVRSPEQERFRKRGEGITIEEAHATLWQTFSESGEEKVLATNVVKVNAKVESLLGFKSEQFRQVVLLPQGEFRKLLLADSKERQDIMQTLFKTEFYKIIEDKLKEETQKYKQTYEELLRKKQWVLDEAGVNDFEELVLRIHQHENELNISSAKLNELSLKLKQAQQDITSGMLVQERFEEQANAKSALAELEGKAEVYAKKAAELKSAILAAGMSDAEHNLKMHEKDVNHLIKSCEELTAQLEVDKRRYNAAQVVLVAEQAKDGERENIAKRIVYLEDIKVKRDGLDTAAKNLRLAEEAFKTAVIKKQNIEKSIVNLEQVLTEKRELLQQTTLLAATFPGRKVVLENLTSLVEKSIQLKRLRDNRDTIKDDMDKVMGRLQDTERQYINAKEKLKKMHEEWMQGQAVIMADMLKEETACPVCGSLQHPSPAKRRIMINPCSGACGSTDIEVIEVPSEDSIRKQQQWAEKLDSALQKCRQDLSNIKTNYATLNNRMKDIMDDLSTYADTGADDLSIKAAEAQAQYDEAMNAEKNQETLTAVIKKYIEKEQFLTVEAANIERTWQNASNALEAAKAVVFEREAGIPAEFRDQLSLHKALAKVKSIQLKMKTDLQTAQQNVQKSLEVLTRTKSAFETTNKQRVETCSRFNEAHKTFNSRLIESGFTTYGEYEQAKKPPEYCQQLNDSINEYQHSLSAARERVLRAVKAAEGLVSPDIEGLQAALASAQQVHSDTLACHTQLKTYLEKEKNWIGSLKKLEADLEIVSQNYKDIGRLSEVANGRNSFGITLQRFVLGALLDDVTEAANTRLKTMSRGRYYIQRTMDRATKRSAGGLELEVFDSYTGVSRPVSTLSGGETFLASLSLALGLADIVQCYSGGIHLDTIFVDEGFGTLDPESLDFAIKALVDLQRDGRLVGIISHVPELKERIDARLEITHSDKGSRASFKVG